MGGDQREENGGGAEEIESNELSSSHEEVDIVGEILSVIESAAQLGDFRRTHRKESCNLVRRMKLLLPFLEEIRDVDSPITEDGIASLSNLKKALDLGQKLLETCNEGSKIHLAVEGEAVMNRFWTVHDKLCQALETVPYDELGISDEIKEQVELMRVQLRRAKRRTDTQDIELAMDMIVLMSEEDDRNADSAIIERLAKKLDLHTVEELENETIAIRNLVRERGSQNAESTQQMIALLNKFKQIIGMEVTDVLNNPATQKKMEKSPSLVIPHEFLCPITLEIMTDPVIIASGQTYERESIQKWFDSDHWSCPKSRQALAHLSVAPNYALKTLILQWCDKNNFKLPKKNVCVTSESSSPEHIEEVLALVENLSSSQLEVQRKAVKKIRMLSKENPENRILLANNGGIEPLVQLLSYPDSKIQEHAVTALLNLSIDENNKALIAKEGAIPAIIEVLNSGSAEARENSAAALFSLSMLDENKVTIGLCDGIPPLVELLKKGTVRGKKDAATALFNLSLNHCNKGRAIEAGIVSPLLQVLVDRNLGMVDEALSIFLLLASHPEGRQEIGQLSFIETLVEFIKEGTPKNKECAISVLLELGSSNSSFILAALQFGVYEHLAEITRSGTNRAQRKANALIQLMTKTEQI